MLTYLRGLLGSTDTGTAASPSSVLPSPEGSGPHSANVPVAPDVAIGGDVRNETLIDRTEQVVGYAFSLVAKSNLRGGPGTAPSRRALDSALLGRLALDEGALLPGQHLAFVNLALESLADPQLEGLRAAGTVLMLELTPNPLVDWVALKARATALRTLGFALGLHVKVATDAACGFLEAVDFVAVDVPSFNGLELREVFETLRKKRGASRKALRQIAHNLQSHDEFLFALKSGFHYFHGPFLNGPRQKTAIPKGINHTVFMPVLNMVMGDASFAEIAEKLRGEPKLTYKIFSYLNSPAMGLQMQISSLTEALNLIGRARLYRWMSLMLFEFTKPSYQERILSIRALTRGRTLELLAGQGNIPREPDYLFLVGVFSLLDTVLALPMEELLELAAVPQSVRNALLNNDGPLADALRLVVLSEVDSTLEPAFLAKAQQVCALDDQVYSRAANHALSWAHSVQGESH